MGTCKLCERKEIELTVHHLIPKEEGGAFLKTALLCKACHKQIHTLYSNKEIALRLYSIPLLKDDEEMKGYLKWIKKQPSSKTVRTKKKRRK